MTAHRLPPNLRWVAFDLDDTLHYFGRASGKAAEAVFCDVERRFGLGTEDLAKAYREILRTAQGDHFTQPKTAREYRAERFEALLGEFGIDSEPRLDRLLDVYDARLAESLELKPGADEALRAARRAGLSVMVISEGPNDAQQTTLERLGISSSVDLLVTSSGEGASKSHGLFEKALERVSCECHEMLYVGDSVDRDISPTAVLGIASVYVGDEELPAGCAASRLDLFTLSELFDRLNGSDR